VEIESDLVPRHWKTEDLIIFEEPRRAECPESHTAYFGHPENVERGVHKPSMQIDKCLDSHTVNIEPLLNHDLRANRSLSRASIWLAMSSS
jgi:hypothetical protein